MPGPLHGVTVVDLSRALAGPHAAMMLGDLGARVIKVESPGTGDDTRGWGPPFVGPEDARESTYFLSCNRNKESIVLDLKSDDGRSILTRLVRASDVLVENFRPGVLDRLGFSAARLHELNPRLVVLSISGFGHDGPQGGRAGYDQIAQGEAGLMSLTGPSPDEPTRIGVPIGDLLAGMYGAYGVVVRAVRAGHDRARAASCAPACSPRSSACTPSRAPGTPSPARCRTPRATTTRRSRRTGPFRCRDAIVQVAVGSEGLWRAFAPTVGIDPADPLFADNAARVKHRQALIELINDAFAERDVADLLHRPGQGGRPGRRGAHPRPGLRVGPDPLAGSGARGRSLHPRPDQPARAAVAVRRSPAGRAPGAAHAGAAQRVGAAVARSGRAGRPDVRRLDRPCNGASGVAHPGQSSRSVQQAGLVRQDRDLHPVADVELDQQPGHMRLHGGLAQVQRRADLVVGQPFPTSVSTSRSRSVRPVSRAWASRRRSARGSSAKWSINRRVTPGDSIASPAATTRTAAISSRGGVSLSRNPAAPACSARNTKSSRSNVVSTMTFGGSGNGPDRGGGGQPVHPGHPDVHQHHVGVMALHRGRPPRRRRPPRRPPPGRRRIPGSSAARRGPARRRRRSGSEPCRTCVSPVRPPVDLVAAAVPLAGQPGRRTRQPPSAVGPLVSVPPSRADPFPQPDQTRRRSPAAARRPRPGAGWSPSTRTPAAASADHRDRRWPRRGRVCAHSSAPPGRPGRRCGPTVSGAAATARAVDGQRRPGRRPHGTTPTSAGTSDSPGCGASSACRRRDEPGSSSRSTPSTPRSSSSASRAVLRISSAVCWTRSAPDVRIDLEPAGLQRDQRHLVRQHVMHLPGDPGPLGEPGLLRP